MVEDESRYKCRYKDSDDDDTTAYDPLPDGYSYINPQFNLIFAKDQYMTAPRFRLLFIMLGMMDRKNCISCSMRMLAQEARISLGTVVRGLKHLEGLDVVHRLSKPNARLRIQLNRNLVNREEAPWTNQ